jgi:hypothetical protein
MPFRTRYIVAAAAVVLSAGLYTTPTVMADTGATAGQSQQQSSNQALPQQPELPAGTKAVDQPKKDSMTESLAEVTHAAASKGSFDDVVDHFVDQDRDRMKAEHKDYSDVKSLAKDINKAFKDKYGKDFNLQDNDVKAQVFADAAVTEGEINDPVALMKAWPVDPTPGMKGNEAQPAAQSLQPGTHETEANANIKKGRQVGVVRLPTNNKLPALDVSMIDEAGGWKIDVPNNRTGQMIHDDLVKQLTMLKDNQANWPDNVNDAYRLFTHHVLMAVYGIQAPQQLGS